MLVGPAPRASSLPLQSPVLVRSTLKSEFRRIDPTSARIVLVDMANRVLGPFSENLSAAAKKRLEDLGVEVRLGRGVDQIDENGVIVAGERIAAKTVIWTAGVTPSPAGKWLGVETDRAGRVRVGKDVSVPGHRRSFCRRRYRIVRAGRKTSSGRRAGRHAARTLRGEVDSPPDCRPIAASAVSLLGQRKHGGGWQGFRRPRRRQGPAQRAFAWLVWGAVHLQFLASVICA